MAGRRGTAGAQEGTEGNDAGVLSRGGGAELEVFSKESVPLDVVR